MSELNLNVVAGQKRELVGTVVPQPGMLTSAGQIDRIVGRTVYFKNGSYRRNLSGVTVRHSEAFAFGYPHAQGSNRIRTHVIKRDGVAVEA